MARGPARGAARIVAPQPKLLPTHGSFAVAGVHVLVVVEPVALALLPPSQIQEPLHRRAVLTFLRREEDWKGYGLSRSYSWPGCSRPVRSRASGKPIAHPLSSFDSPCLSLARNSAASRAAVSMWIRHDIASKAVVPRRASTCPLRVPLSVVSRPLSTRRVLRARLFFALSLLMMYT